MGEVSGMSQQVGSQFGLVYDKVTDLNTETRTALELPADASRVNDGLHSLCPSDPFPPGWITQQQAEAGASRPWRTPHARPGTFFNVGESDMTSVRMHPNANREASMWRELVPTDEFSESLRVSWACPVPIRVAKWKDIAGPLELAK